MKKLFLIFIFFISFISMFSQTNVTAEVRKIMEKGGYTESTTQYAYISKGNIAYHWKTFYKGNNYAIIGFPEDADCYDIDLFLYDEDGRTLLAKSATDENVEIIEYKPYTTRKMKVVIKNYDSKNPSSEYKVKFMIFYK